MFEYQLDYLCRKKVEPFDLLHQKAATLSDIGSCGRMRRQEQPIGPGWPIPGQLMGKPIKCSVTGTSRFLDEFKVTTLPIDDLHIFECPTG